MLTSVAEQVVAIRQQHPRQFGPNGDRTDPIKTMGIISYAALFIRTMKFADQTLLSFYLSPYSFGHIEDGLGIDSLLTNSSFGKIAAQCIL